MSVLAVNGYLGRKRHKGENGNDKEVNVSCSLELQQQRFRNPINDCVPTKTLRKCNAIIINYLDVFTLLVLGKFFSISCL